MLYADVTLTSRPPLSPFTVLLNAHAGRGLARRKWPALQAELERRAIPFTLLETASADEARRHMQTLVPGTPVMTVGGDGTVAGILPFLVESGRPLAVIPLGSGNDFAGMLGLKPGDFGEALDRLAYAPRAADVLDIHVLEGDLAGERRLMLNGLGMGFDAQVNQAMKRAPARWPGLARYAWGALTSIRHLHLLPVTVQVDGQPFYSGPSCLCAVMNGTRYGGGFRISPRSDARDGLLNVVASGPIDRAELVKLMLQVLAASHLDKPKVHATQGRHVSVRWDSPIALHIDGEDAGMVRSLQVTVRPNAVQLLNA